MAQISFANEVTRIFFLIPLQEEKASQLFVPPSFRVQRKRARKRGLHPNVLNTFYYLEAIVTWKFSIFSLPALYCCVFKCSCVFKRNLITQSLPDQRQRYRSLCKRVHCSLMRRLKYFKWLANWKSVSYIL